MRLIDFLKDKFLLILLHIFCMCTLGIFLHVTGYSFSNLILIEIFWLLILGTWLLATYIQRYCYFRQIEQTLDRLDQRYLLGEMMPDSYRLEDKLYREMIRKSNKSVIEKIHQIEDEKKDYREYIESWVHEIKMPITSIALTCENRRRSNVEELRTIGLENQKIENYVDMALYYARSDEVYKDYLISETDLQEVVYEVLAKNQGYLIQNQVQAEVDCPDLVYTDKKWIAFILNQMILNSIKYRGDTPMFKFYTTKQEQGVLLALEDNGTGIGESELARIFEKGFTGSNGRSHERATGMGLYLCRKLCQKLGIEVWAESIIGKGTRMILDFPISSYLSKL